MNQVLEAVDRLNDKLLAADSIGQAFDLAGGETSPAWVTVYRDQIEAIRQAAEAVELLLRKAEHVHA